VPVVDWITPDYEHRSKDVSSRATRNLYVESTEGQGKTRVILVGTPGTQAAVDFSADTTGDVRAIYNTSVGRFFAFVGDGVFEVERDANATQEAYIYTRRATISDDGSSISVTDDGLHMVWTDGSNVRYLKFSDNTLGTPQLPPDVTSLTQVLFFGQRIVGIDGSNFFYWSKILNATDWEDAKAAAEQSADPIVRLAKRQGELALMGPRSIEYRRVGPDPDAPYPFVGGSANEVGTQAAESVATIKDQIFWLGSSRSGQNQVFVSDGYGARRISNHAIEYQLTRDIDLNVNTEDSSGTTAFTYQQEGHVFYVLTLNGSNRTFVYDLTNGFWHERTTRDPLLNIQNKWQVNTAETALNRVFAGTSRGPVLVTLNLDKYDEWDGRPIVRLHQSPVYWNSFKRLVHRRFIVDLETGVGLQEGQGSDPRAMMQYSDDGGHTWSSERIQPFGKIGKYATRLQWVGLGSSRERVYRFSVSDPVKVVLIGAALEIEEALNP